MEEIDDEQYDAAIATDDEQGCDSPPMIEFKLAPSPEPLASLLYAFPELDADVAATILGDANGNVETATRTLLEQRAHIGAWSSAQTEHLPFRHVSMATRTRPGHFKPSSPSSPPATIFEAVERDDFESTTAMITRGANINELDEYGRSLVMIGSLFGVKPIMMRLLLDAGANHALKDRAGDTPAKEARRRGHYALATLLDAASLREKLRLRRRLRRTMIVVSRFAGALVELWHETISPGGRTYKRARLEFEGCRALL